MKAVKDIEAVKGVKGVKGVEALKAVEAVKGVKAAGAPVHREDVPPALLGPGGEECWKSI